MDKLEKVPRDAIEEDLAKLGLDGALVDTMLATLGLRELSELFQERKKTLRVNPSMRPLTWPTSAPVGIRR